MSDSFSRPAAGGDPDVQARVAAGPFGSTHSAAPASRLLDSLARATEQSPDTRKRLIAPDVNFGRELLVALARRTGGWIGWEATSLRAIADELAFVPLARVGRRIAGDVEIAALINASLRTCADSGRLRRDFVQLGPSLGFRRSVRDAVLELRTASVSAAELTDRSPRGAGAHDLARVLAEYEKMLNERALADPAAVFEAAIAHFDEQAPFTLDRDLWFAPSAVTRGFPATLAARLRAFGARDLEADVDYDAPAITLTDATIDVFSGATPSEELREAFRRILGEGLRFDEVEIVTTDPDTYGIALDVLSGQLDVGVTMLHGVPLARTRLGRALERWLAWLSDGLPSDLIRQALEAGELGAGVAGLDLPPAALARELRGLRIGWGRARYEHALIRLDAQAREPRVVRYDAEQDAEYELRLRSRQRSARGLAALLAALLHATPVVPERGGVAAVMSSVAALAESTLAWLALVPVHGEAEVQTSARLASRLRQIADVHEPPTTFAGAMAGLRDALCDLRAWPQRTAERKPWSSAGGMVHLTDLRHAGTTGRARVFVVGLDAERTHGAGLQDPLLPDAVRQRVAPDRLATSGERRADRETEAIASLSALRGRVTLSYATSGSLDGRESGPAALLLNAWRAACNDDSLSYEKLREHVRPPAAAVPQQRADDFRNRRALLDRRDVWLDVLSDGGLLRDGTSAVRVRHTMLDAGLRARDARMGADPCEHHGLVVEAAGKLDPSRRSGREISPSSLEQLAACPLAWFYRYGLSLRAPADPEYDRDRWLDDLQRGSLLHEVYEAFMRSYQHRQHEIQSENAERDLLEIVDEKIEKWRGLQPPPGESVFQAEAAALRRGVLVFLAVERERAAAGDTARWRDFELKFGGAGGAPGIFEIAPGRSVAVKGIIDRVDELPDGGLRIVDYKTGSNYRFKKDPKRGAFNGGRQLQAAVYATVSTAVLGAPVTSFEYRFPTERGGGEIIAYGRAELEAAKEIVAGLLRHVERGTFVPTDSESDCTYCEYGPICGVKAGAYASATHSPPARWAADNSERLEVYAIMRRLRGAPASDARGDARG